MARPPSAAAVTIDAEIAVRACESRKTDHRLAVLLASMDDERKLHREFGYANLADYAHDRHQLEPRRARELRVIGRKLVDLPLVGQAMADGELDWTKVREVVRVAKPETEAAWLALAKTATSRELERARRQSEEGLPSPHVGRDDASETVTVTLVMTRGELEMLQTSLQWLRAACGPEAELVDDGPLLAMIAQRVLAEADPETAPTPDRHRFVVESRGDGAVDVTSEACCDAEVVALGPGPKHGHLSHSIPPSVRRAVLHRDAHRCQVPGCSNRLWLDLHHVDFREHGGKHTVGNVLTACSVHHRLVHDGHLDIVREEGGFRFVFPDGRQVHRAPRGAGRMVVRGHRKAAAAPHPAAMPDRGARPGSQPSA